MENTLISPPDSPGRLGIIIGKSTKKSPQEQIPMGPPPGKFPPRSRLDSKTNMTGTPRENRELSRVPMSSRGG